MYPTYRGMSSHPYQMSQTPSSQYYIPVPSPVPARTQVKEDPAAARPSFMYESWPQNYGYPTPMQCPNCCNSQYPPAYYNFRPPCPHFPSPPPTYGHFCGGYPPYPQPPYPASYVPPPHYTMEIPRYECDKNASRELHCCGCPHHSCHSKEGKNVKIEEHEPEFETKRRESLVPAAKNNFSHPILWIPPGYMMNQEQQQLQPQRPSRRLVDNEGELLQVSPYVRKPHWQRKPSESEAGECLESPRVKKPQQSVKSIEQEPNVRYELFPLDMNSIRELLEGGKGRKAHDRESKGGEEKKIQDVENEEQNKHFPFPIFWMPYNGQGENNVQGQEEKDAEEAPRKEACPTFKIIPMKFEHPENEPEKIKTAVGDAGTGVGAQASEKTSNLKTIPVKQLEEPVPKQLKKEDERKGKLDGTPVKNVEGNGNGQSSSPTKKSKLPPICLRVDPPKKKNGNGSSRSPSPPADKKRQESGESKMEGNKKEIKVAEVVDKAPSKVEISRKAGEEMKEKHGGDAEKKGLEGQQSLEAKESKPQEAKKPERKILSEQEAATIIQSTYRGHDVRRWEPLKKLRQIAKIRGEAAEVKRHIDDIESRDGSSVDEKEKVAVAETIMKLLLKLDTIQGLPPSFRDVRRSVAKELIMSQERLDSIINQKSAPVAQETSTAVESPKVSGQDEASKAAKEPAEVSNQVEDSKVEAGEEHVNVSGLDEISRGDTETAEVPNQLEDSKVEAGGEPLNISGLDESSRDEGETAEESSEESSRVESPEGEIPKSAESGKEDETIVTKDNPPVGPLNTQDAVGGSEYETSKPSPENMESETQPHNEIASSAPLPTIVDSPTDTKEPESDQTETVEGKLLAEPQDSSAGIDSTVNTTEQLAVTSEGEGHQVHLLPGLPQEVKQDKKDIPTQVDIDSGATCEEESAKSAPPTPPTSQAPNVESEPAEKDEKVNVQAELPKEVTEEGVKEQTSEIPSSETLNRDQEEEDQSVEVIRKAITAVETETCKLEFAELPGIKAQKVQEAELADIDGPILEESQQEPTIEAPTPEEAASKVTETKEESKQSSRTHGTELDSSMASHEDQLSHKVDASESIGSDQERTLEERDSTQDHLTVPSHENLNVQAVDSETEEASKITTQEARHEEQASKEPKEGKEEEQIDKRIIEENEKLREMLERLITSGKEQQDLISSLSGKVKDLEKKLARKKKMKSSKRPRVQVSRGSCVKPSNGSLRGRPMGVAS